MGEETETFKEKLYKYEKLDKEINKFQTKLKSLKSQRKELEEEIKQHMNDGEVDEVELKEGDSIIKKQESSQKKPLPKKALETRIKEIVKDDPEKLQQVNNTLQERNEVNTLKLKREKY